MSQRISKKDPFLYQGLEVELLVDVKKFAPFDNEFHAKKGDKGRVVNTINGYHSVKIGNSLPVRVKVEDTKIVY